MHRPLQIFGVALLLSLLAAGGLWAETGAGLLLKSWPEGEQAQIRAKGLFLGQSDTEGAAVTGFRMQRYDFSGRWRANAESTEGLSLGMDFTHIELHTALPALPERLVNHTMAAAFGIGFLGEGKLGVTVGGGFAGDNPYTDGDAAYGKANLVYSHELSADESFQLFLNYDGHRTFTPDIPLPGFAYNLRVDDTYRYTLGLPYTAAHWRASDQVRVDVGYYVPFTFDVVVTYEATEDLDLSLGLHNRFEAFHLSGLPEHRRLFVQQRTAEAAAHWTPCPGFDLTLAGGYAFDQEFDNGFDSRDLNTVVDVDDAPYLRFDLSVKF